MTTLLVNIDDRTESALQQLSEREGKDRTEIASRLLARAIRALRPRPVYDPEALKAAYAEFAEDDIALAEAGSTERADLLAQEDAA